MNSNDNKFPILIEHDGKILRLMEIVYEKDNSMYFVFPRKNGYKIDKICIKEYSKNELSENEHEENILQLDDINKIYCNPKISFHPRDMIVHIKSQDNRMVKENYEIYNIAPAGELFCYLIQIIFPLNFTAFDEYKKTKYKNVLNINNNPNIDKSKLNFANNNLNIEIFIHSNGIEPTEKNLPFSLNRNFKYMATFEGDNLFSHTIVVSEIDANNEDSVLICINTKWHCLVYTLKPN